MTTTVRPCPLPLSNFPHILRSIVDHADRNITVTLLRTSYQLFNICGPRLYREVYLDLNTLRGVFHGWDDERRSSTSKRCLLKHIKIVSVTQHNQDDCFPLAAVVASLISPDVVRVVCPILGLDLDHIHMCGDDVCGVLPNIDTKKVVFRNVDNSQGFGLYGAWNAPRLEEVVYILPRDDRVAYRENHLEDEIEEHWQGVPKLKLVFGEYEKPAPWGLDPSFSPGENFEDEWSDLLDRRDLIDFLESAMDPNRTLEVCGVDTIPFMIDGQLRFLDEKEVKEVEAQVRLEAAEDSKGKAELVFKTLQEYCDGDTYGEVTREEKDRWLQNATRHELAQAEADAGTAGMDVD